MHNTFVLSCSTQPVSEISVSSARQLSKINYHGRKVHARSSVAQSRQIAFQPPRL